MSLNSKMMSEARTFSDSENSSINGVTRTISYDYTLAGQLKSITDPAGATITSGYDLVGRLNGVTASSFGSVTTYASGAEYRAWGGLKHLNYGNTKTVDATYNARLQAATFTIPTVMSKSYSYFADGELAIRQMTESVIRKRLPVWTIIGGRFAASFGSRESFLEPAQVIMSIRTVKPMVLKIAGKVGL